MTTLCRLLIMPVVLAVAAGSPLAAQEARPPRSAGRVLLLQSDRGLEGDIEKFGDQYRVRRGSSEVWLPAEKALRLCADWEEALAYMKTRANLGDPDERLRLARWCQLNNLRAQALAEAQAALDMRPAHQESRQLVAMLTRAVASPPAAPAQAPAPRTSKAPLAPPPSDICSDSFGLFATRVQPILMNACVGCHSGGRGGNFQLLRTEAGQRGATQANLAAVLEQVRTDHPALSPLLIKAVSRHGDTANAPIKNRQAIPFKTLEAWIDHLLANNPHLRYQDPPQVAAASKTTPEPAVFAQAQALSAPTVRKQAAPTPGQNAKPTAVSKPVPRADVPGKAAQPAKLPPLPEAEPLNPYAPKESSPTVPDPVAAGSDELLLNPLDPFDPAAFNRQTRSRK
jgi:hypothetical protein